MSADIALRHVFSGFTLDVKFALVAPGVTALFGPSGAGKSTVIHALAGLMRPQYGHIVFDGETLLDTERKIFVPACVRRIGVVFQDARLFPHLSVKNNLLYGWKRTLHKAGTTEIDAVIALLGLEALLDRRPRTLSGGEKSRLALGRALLANPRALLLDEPLAALDTARKAEILPYLERLHGETKIPMLYVSHSQDEIASLADRVIVLRRGRIAAEGSIFDITTRLDLATGDRIVGGTVLSATVKSHDNAQGTSELDVGGERLIVPAIARTIGGIVRIRIDADDVMLALQEPAEISANNVLPAIVAAVHADDNTPYAEVQLMWNGTRLISRITRRSLGRLQLAPGVKLFAVIKSVTVGKPAKS